MAQAQLFIGIMSGTSLDGIDVALANLGNHQYEVIATNFLPYPDDVKNKLLSLHFSTENELEKTAIVANQLAQLYAQAVNDLLNKNNFKPKQIKAIGCHGQTIRHQPQLENNLGFSIQIGNAALLAELTDICVVTDFRSREIAAGGQGAPLVPAFHKHVFGSAQKNRAIVNIGGIANITYLAKNGGVLGFDSGPGNMLLDSWAKLHLNKDYDADGVWAASGIVHENLLNDLLTEPYFAISPPKSTGRDLFNDIWLRQHTLPPLIPPQDIACTLVALTAQTIHQAILKYCPEVDEVYVCGGGGHNALLMQNLKDLLDTTKLNTTDALGVGIDWVEAAAFAWLAKQTLENKPGNLPEVTGAKGLRVLGAIYPA